MGLFGKKQQATKGFSHIEDLKLLDKAIAFAKILEEKLDYEIKNININIDGNLHLIEKDSKFILINKSWSHYIEVLKLLLNKKDLEEGDPCYYSSISKRSLLEPIKIPSNISKEKEVFSYVLKELKKRHEVISESHSGLLLVKERVSNIPKTL